MLDVALADDIFDVIMVGYNMMNPSAAKTILPRAIKQNVGVQCMFAVRRALSDPAQMNADIQKILDNNQGGVGLEATENALDFLTALGADGTPIASSIMDAAYRFCNHTAGIHVTLTGTSSEAHLTDNLKSLKAKPLPADVLDKLAQLFGLSDCVSGQ
jgi:aryl-alcohol dehydrogenase-like predicted oxidoreductase